MAIVTKPSVVRTVTVEGYTWQTLDRVVEDLDSEISDHYDTLSRHKIKVIIEYIEEDD